MLIFIIQITIFWLVGWLIYALFLSKETFHQWNRIYLFLVIAVGLEIPFLDIASPLATLPTFLLPAATIVATASNELPVVEVSAETFWTWELLLTSVYVLGVLGSAFLFLRELWQLRKLYLTAPKSNRNGYIWVAAPSITSPFSFGSLLFWNQDPSQPKHHYILQHELAHIKQQHTLDKLVLQLLGIVLWWHPMIYLFKRAFYQLHEFLADQAAIQNGSKKQYGQLLLHYSLTATLPSYFGNTLIQSPIKNRITMLLSPLSSSQNKWKYLAALPLLAFVIFACQQESTVISAEKMLTPTEQSSQIDTVVTFDESTKEWVINTTSPTGETKTETVKSTIKKEDLENTASFEEGDYLVDTIITFNPETFEESMSLVKTPVYKEVDEMPRFGNCPNLTGKAAEDCSNKALLNYIFENITYPQPSKEAGVEGTVITKFIIRADGFIDGIEIMRSVNEEIDTEVKRVVRSMSDWQPGKKNGENVNVQFILPVKFKME